MKPTIIIAILFVIGIVTTILVMDEVQYQALIEKRAFCIDMLLSIEPQVYPHIDLSQDFTKSLDEYKSCKYEYENMRLDYWDLRYTSPLLKQSEIDQMINKLNS